MNTFEVVLGVALIIAIIVIVTKNKEKIKIALQKRIERNAVKIPNVTWTDKKGVEHTEDIVIKRSALPFIGDWSRIYPPIDEEGKINKVNAIFGGKKNLIKLIIFLGIALIVLLGFVEVFSSYEALKETCEPYLNLNLKP